MNDLLRGPEEERVVHVERLVAKGQEAGERGGGKEQERASVGRHRSGRSIHEAEERVEYLRVLKVKILKRKERKEMPQRTRRT